MGKNNRIRRAAKARKRRARRSQSDPESRVSIHDLRPGISGSDRFVAAANAARAGDLGTERRAVELLAEEPPRSLAPEIAQVLELQVGHLWDHGWQPADVARVVGRELGRPESVLIGWVLHAEAAPHAALGRRVAPDWMAQLDDLGTARSEEEPYLVQLGCAWVEALQVAVRVAALLVRLPPLPELVDPPSRWRDGRPAVAASLPNGMLEKVRALLAKAESTVFDAEAEAFTAKAQELMARHRIDHAMFEASRHQHAKPESSLGRRIGVDDPYADAKALLLSEIADANDCRTIWSRELGFATVFGFAPELDAVDELFTSLLVQATAAVRREGSRQDRYGSSRTTRFRRSFLTAFALRIGERLRDVVAATVSVARDDLGGALVPVLAARSEATRAAAEKVFPEVAAFSPRANDAEGWHAGTRFGDVADIAVRRAVGRRSA